MPEFITIEEAARITGFPSEEIQQWAISKKITSYVVKQGVRLVDLTNLREFISHIERMGIQKLYLQLIIQDKEEEINEIISQFDDYLFCLRSLKNISPLLKLIIAELQQRQLEPLRQQRLQLQQRQQQRLQQKQQQLTTMIVVFQEYQELYTKWFFRI